MTPMKYDLPRLLSPEAARTPEMQALWEWICEQDKGLPDTAKMPIKQARPLQARLFARWNHDLPAVALAERLSISVAQGARDIRCEMVVPHKARPGCILFQHGGGWAFGDLESHERFTYMLAVETGLRVLAVDYRLAPEHPYPAGLNDACAAWAWLCDEAVGQPGMQGPLMMAGDSAGANLAMAAMLRGQDEGERAPAAALLFYGAYAADLDSPSCQRFAEGYGFTRARLAQLWDWYAPRERRDEPFVCPGLADGAALAALPPLYLNAAGLDPLLCDTLDLAARLQALGARHALTIHEGMHHGFMQMSAELAEARRAFALAGRFARAVVAV